MTPLFSIVLATRDRPALFAEALESVLAQDWRDFEVIVIDDGSSAANVDAYRPVWDAAAARLGDAFTVRSLLHRPRGHGQSYSLNHGVSLARGTYVGFLDDDDKWTDAGHLSRAAQALQGAARSGAAPVDLYMSNQTAWAADGRCVGTLWLGTLEAELQQRGRTADAGGVYRVDIDDLMMSSGFCHLNCLIARRELFDAVGGMDEGIRWECDRDLLLKLTERAAEMRFHPGVVSYHRVPDPSKTTNMTTALGMLEKRLLQSIVLDRALLRARHPAVRRHALQHKTYALERMAQGLAERGDFALACSLAGQAFGARPSLGRAWQWLRLAARRFLRGDSEVTP